MALPALPAGAQPLVEQVSEQLQAAWHKVQPYAKVGAADGRRVGSNWLWAAPWGWPRRPWVAVLAPG